MTLIITTSILGFVGLVLVLAVYRRFTSPQRTLPLTAEWIDELSIERYRPMLGLLNQQDLQFLRKQPGFTPQMESRLRILRCQIFRVYLRHLDNDFNRICMALKLVMWQSNLDRPDLASALIQRQTAFACARVMVQCQLMLYRYGIGSVSVTGLVKLFDGMRLELRTMVPAESNLAA